MATLLDQNRHMTSALPRLESLTTDAELFFRPVSPALEIYGVGATNSVSAGPDNGDLNNLATVFWQAKRHRSVKELSANLAAAPVEELNLAGHGSMGLLEAGFGTGSYADDKQIASYNIPSWRKHMAAVPSRAGGSVRMYSCSTGAGSWGAKLLWALARTMDRTVRASTGNMILYSQGSRRWLAWERGSTWQEATADMADPPAPIPEPGVDPTLVFANGERRGGEPVLLPSDVDSAVLTSPPSPESGGSELGGERAASLLPLLFHSFPFVIDGYVLGIVTREIVIRRRGGDPLRVLVYGRSLVYLPRERVYFRASPQLGLSIGLGDGFGESANHHATGE